MIAFVLFSFGFTCGATGILLLLIHHSDKLSEATNQRIITFAFVSTGLICVMIGIGLKIFFG